MTMSNLPEPVRPVDSPVQEQTSGPVAGIYERPERSNWTPYILTAAMIGLVILALVGFFFIQ